MPFRMNMFGDKIAQPGTTRTDIDMVLCDSGVFMGEINSAEIYPDWDDDFKIGGELFITGESDDGEYVDAPMNFDGFETIEEARAWLLSLDLSPSDISESA